MTRVLVCGSRDWTDSGEIAYHLALIFGKDPDRLVIHGNCGDLMARPPRGADVLAGWCAAGVGAAVEVCPVDHAVDGPWPSAGPRRNERMFRESRPDRGLAFGALWKRVETGTIPQQTFFDLATWNGPVLVRERRAPNRGDVGRAWTPTGTGGMVKIMLDAGVPVRWVPAPTPRAVDILPAMGGGSRYVDFVEMPRP